MKNGEIVNSGMTLRDWFAGQVHIDTAETDSRYAEALVGRKLPINDLRSLTCEEAMQIERFWSEFEAKIKYLRADAMIAEREKEAKPK